MLFPLQSGILGQTILQVFLRNSIKFSILEPKGNEKSVRNLKDVIFALTLRDYWELQNGWETWESPVWRLSSEHFVTTHKRCAQLININPFDVLDVTGSFIVMDSPNMITSLNKVLTNGIKCVLSKLFVVYPLLARKSKISEGILLFFLQSS